VRCPSCDEVVPEGCLCEITDTDCFAITGDGSAATPFGVDAVLDADSANLLSCSGDGLLAALPAAIASPPACSAYNSANISAPDNTGTVVTLNSEYYDTDTMHSTTVNTSRITFTTAGIYVVTFVCLWNKNANGDRQAQIRKNGSDTLVTDSKHAGSADLFVGHSCTVQDSFAAGDYVEGIVKQDSGGALNLLAQRESPILSAVYRRQAP
jgi:hypothetical protein